MWGNETRRIAEEAKRVAQQAISDTSTVAVLIREHIADCSRRTESLARDLAERERAMRLDQDKWREGLGVRLDKQDAMNWRIAAFVITCLFGIVGTLLHTYGLIK